MNILKALYALFLQTPTLSGFVLLALFVYLFRLGMSSGFEGARQRGLPFFDSLANGWARGWLLLFIPILLWMALMFLMLFLSGADTGLDLEIQAVMIFIGGLIILILTPGILIIRRIRAQYPAVSQKTANLTAAVWALVYPVCFLAIGALVAMGAYFRLLPWRWSISWPWMVIAVLLIIPLVSKAVGKRITAWLLRDVAESSAPSIGETDAPPPSFERIPQPGFVPPAWINWLQRIPIARTFIGWGLVWALLTWLIAERFAIFGTHSKADFLWLSLRFYFLTVFIVSIGAGLVAALLMRGPATSWYQTGKTAIRWIFSGLIGWGFGIPIGWIAVVGYQRAFNLPPQIIIDSQGLVKGWTAWEEIGQPSLLIGGFAALIIGGIVLLPGDE